MRQVNATDFKNHLGEFLDMVRDEPIQVRRSGRPVAVLVSWEEYEHLQSLEDAYSAAKARAAQQSGQFLSHEEWMKLLTDLLIRHD
jgi:prevent-host-death family protein